MFLRIACHPEVELRTGVLDGGAVGKESLVETHHLPNQVSGMGVPSGCGSEPAVLLRFVTTQQHEVADTQELQVEQLILNLLYRRTAAYHMRLHGDVVPVLDSGSDGYRTRSATNALTLKLTVLQFLVDIFRMMCGDVDKRRVENREFINRLEQRLGAVPFQWWQHLKGEAPLTSILLDIICYCHLRVPAQYATKLLIIKETAKF